MMWRGQLWQYPAKTQPVHEVALPTLDWLVQQPDPVRRPAELVGEQFAFTRLVELSEIPIGWLPQYPDFVRGPPELVHEQLAFLRFVGLSEITIDWSVQHPDPVRPPERLVPEALAFEFEHELLVPPIDWLAQLPGPIQELRRPPTQPATPELVEIPPPVVVFDWLMQHPDPVQPEGRRQDWYVLGEVPVEIPIETWLQPPSEPVLPLPPRQDYYARDLTIPEALLDQWWQPASQPVRLPLRIQGQIVFVEFAAPPGVLVAFVFRECQALWEIVHPSSWESAVASSGYIPPPEYIPPASGYIAVEGGTAPWDMVR